MTNTNQDKWIQRHRQCRVVKKAIKSPSKEEKVTAICFIYQGAVNNGRSDHCIQDDNPYPVDTEEWYAWDYGWQEGHKQQIKNKQFLAKGLYNGLT